MDNRKVFTCFISSPGDCIEERESCKRIIGELNEGFAKHFGVGLEKFMWESDVLPDMGRNGQEIIDEHINKVNYDIFIGIMKNRFGQPTLRAGSGTEHEFQDALERKIANSNGLPRIIFFFGKQNVDPELFDFEQYQKVRTFKSNVSSKGIYVEYNGVSHFEELVRQKLELFIKDNTQIDNADKVMSEIDIIKRRLESDLEESLTTYNERTPVWIDPILSTRKEIPNSPNSNSDNRIDIASIIKNPQDYIIKAPSEFGLTCLAHYVKLEAYKQGKIFFYVDAKKTKKHKVVGQVKRDVENYYFRDYERIDCILLDSVNFEENGVLQMIKNICEEFGSIPLIIFNTLDNNYFINSQEDDKVEIKRRFQSLYLLPLPQTELRKIVTGYSKSKSIAEDYNVVLEKVAKDLETLNMHRTPKNCISILRASSRIGSEYSPINRTKLLDTILNSIFEEYEIPTFHSKKPDVKDCSFVLGYLCELLVMKNEFYFTEEFFNSSIRDFCQMNMIELDVNYLLALLIDNSIIGRASANNIYFKNAYWVFFFIAHRMNMSPSFLKQVYENKRYVDYPEIMEFYTGIDRNKSDALEILNRDLDETLGIVKAKVNIPDSINPYKSISWNPDIPQLEREQEKLKANVISSGLPDEVKDKYADKHYNQIKPYNQIINSVLRDYSFLILMRQITATARALRNSDFVDVNLRRQVLDKILQSWNELNKLLIVLHPLLAERGSIAFEGARFDLDEDDFNISDPLQKRMAVLLAVPTNVVKFFKDDLFSNKMGPLLIDKAVNESNTLLKHEIMLLLIAERPNQWHKTVDEYIVSLDKNSFFLSDVLAALMYNKDYHATKPEEHRLLDYLAQKCRAKHIYQKKNPDMGLINRAKKL